MKKRRFHLGACVGALGSIIACGTTPGRSIRVPVYLRAEASSAAEASTFTTLSGWTVHLEEAKIALASIELHSPRQEAEMASIVRTALTAFEEFMLPLARAHGGHEPSEASTFRGELVAHMELDLLSAEDVFLGELQGVTGEVDHLNLRLASLQGALRPSSCAGIRGQASQGARTVAFAGELDLPNTEGERSIDQIPAPGQLEDQTALFLRTHVAAWLDRADFDRVASDGSIESQSQVASAWRFALRTLGAWDVEVATELGEQKR